MEAQPIRLRWKCWLVISLSDNVYIYIYMCVCVCVRVCVLHFPSFLSSALWLPIISVLEYSSERERSDAIQQLSGKRFKDATVTLQVDPE